MFGSMAVLETGHVLVEPVLAGELVGSREVVHSLVRPQAGKSMRSRMRARPEKVEVVACLRHLERNEVDHPSCHQSRAKAFPHLSKAVS